MTFIASPLLPVPIYWVDIVACTQLKVHQGSKRQGCISSVSQPRSGAKCHSLAVFAYGCNIQRLPTQLHCDRRYQIRYTVRDDYQAATPITINITFVEVAVVTGSFLFIGQAPSGSVAQQRAVQLNTTGSPANTALTTAVASVFQSWLASATRSYVYELTTNMTAPTIAASNTLQLGLFSSVGMQDVTVVSAIINPNVTAALNANNSGAAAQNYAYAVTLQVAVLTADMLVSVFVDVLNSTGSQRRLLVSNSKPATDHLWAASEQQRPAGATLPHKVTAQHAGSWQQLPSVSTDNGRLIQQLGLETLKHAPPVEGGTAFPRHELHAAMIRAQHAQPMLVQSGHASVTHRDHSSVQNEAGVVRSLLLRYLLQSTASTAAFPLASLLLFKRQLVLAAFTSTSGCSTVSLAQLFYQDSDFPANLESLCGREPAADRSLDAALLAMSNSSVPLLQVSA